jgi:glycosyltransferase involved in cell wall biosynthesis
MILQNQMGFRKSSLMSPAWNRLDGRVLRNSKMDSRQPINTFSNIMHKISIIVPSFNSIDFIDETVRSIRDQQLKKEQYEVIFVDGYSKDGTFEYLDTLKKSESGIDITVIQSAPKGIYDGCNVGIRAAKYEYILILMSDDCLYPKALPKYLDFIEKNP